MDFKKGTIGYINLNQGIAPMTKQLFLLSSLFTSILVTTLSANDRPNVLFIIADDLNCYLGAYGNKDAISPNIDKLASRGTLFSKAICQFPVCGPSRASFMSGLRPNTTGIKDNGSSLYELNPGLKSIPAVFREEETQEEQI